MNSSTIHCMYLRKSRFDILYDEEHPIIDTLQRHEIQLKKLALSHNHTIVKLYREIATGETIRERPVMQKLLQEVKTGIWHSVYVMDIDRLARGNTLDQGIIFNTFFYSDTKIITPVKTYHLSNEFDEEYLEFHLFMSRREYKLINRRIQRGRLQSAKEGKYIGSIAPYGYKRIKLNHEKGWSLIPDPPAADIVRLIFHLYTSDTESAVTIKQISDYLNQNKIPSPSGKAWSLSSVQSILRNPVYAGYITYGKRPRMKTYENEEIKCHRPNASVFSLYEGCHEPLVSKKQFMAAECRKRKPRTIL